MRTIIATFLLLSTQLIFAQAAGNAVYGSSGKRDGVNKYIVASQNDSQFVVTANVLYVKKADYLKITFAISSFDKTLENSKKHSDETIDKLSSNFRKVNKGIQFFVDYVGHNRVYGLQKEGSDYTEVLTGFELKRNIIVVVKDHNEMNKIIEAASESGVFDVAKVEYVVEKISEIEEFLIDKASSILQKKADKIITLNNLTGFVAQRLFDLEFKSFSPSDLYVKYEAAVKQDVDFGRKSNSNIVFQQPVESFYFQGLNHSGFDEIIEEEKLEPAVQFAISLKMVYAKK